MSREGKNLKLVEHFRKMWYGGGNNEEDIYNSNDFDGLWKIEEQEEPSINQLGKKEKGYNPQSYKERTNVIEHPTLTPQSEVVVIEPRSFDEALEIIEELRCRRSIVLNLQYLDSEQSQRVVDFLSGATHALDGHQQRIGQGVFIFAPSNFTINTESQEARALKDAFWSRNKDKEKEKEQQSYEYAQPMKKSSIF